MFLPPTVSGRNDAGIHADVSGVTDRTQTRPGSICQDFADKAEQLQFRESPTEL